MFQDVSCNEITIIPPHLGSVSTLQRLNLKRNLLVEIPIGNNFNIFYFSDHFYPLFHFKHELKLMQWIEVFV